MVTIGCNFCPASFTGSAVEAIQWDSSHIKFCPGPSKDKN
jgi:hypothetical protein